MNNSNINRPLIGLLAGLSAAVLGMAIISLLFLLPAIALLLGCLISLPIFIAAFGWGTKTSIIAILVATVALTITADVHVGIGFLLLFFLPAVYAAWLLGLAKTSQTTKTKIWYPLSSVILILTSFISIISVFLGFYLQNQPSLPLIAQQVSEIFAQAIRQSDSANEIEIAAFKDMLTANIVPIISSAIAIYSLIFLIGNLYLSMVTAQKIKRLARPREDWPKKFRLPIAALVIFIVAFVASYIKFDSIIDLCAMVFNTTFTIALSISGLAYLHNLTRGIRSRFFILAFVYLAIFTFILALPVSIMILLMGIWATIQHNHLKQNLQ